MEPTEPRVSHSGMSNLQHPRYGAGLLLEAEDLTAGVDYTRGLMQLLMRHLFGCGVVCGLDVSAARTCRSKILEVTVGLGLALDGAGNPIHLPGPSPVTVKYDPECYEMPPRVWITACYLEKCCRPKNVACSPDEDGATLHTRSRDAFEIRVYGKPPPCACACKRKDAKVDDPMPVTPTGSEVETNCDCYADHNDGKCGGVCDCPCVLLGEIDTTQVFVRIKEDGVPEYRAVDTTKEKDGPLRVITRDVRRVRPILTGFRPCLEPAKPKPATGVPPNPNEGGGGPVDPTGNG